MSAQGVVERASAELSKRITGLGLRGKHHSRNGMPAPSGKASVMERVTNVFCGGNATSVPPDKPSRFRSKSATGVIHPVVTPQTVRKLHLPDQPQTWQDLLLDDRFLTKFFSYFSAGDRRTLAQVCVRWRDLLYRSPRYWAGLVPVVRCRELRLAHPQDRARFYSNLLRRGFSAVCLLGAADEDALDLVHSFPLASKHVHSISLRCSSISDRGLEALLDHLQHLEVIDCRRLQPQTWQDLLLDDRFLTKFFSYFSAGDRRTLAQVCVRWRDLLYRSPRYWAGQAKKPSRLKN